MKKELELLKEKMDFWKTGTTILAPIVFTLIAIVITLFSVENPVLKNAAGILIWPTLGLFAAAFVYSVMYYAKHLKLTKELEK
jgi:hypothetical protein